MEENELCGVLLVNKPLGCTSHDVVGRVRKLYHLRRVGHTGTLDPMAEGLLVVLVGRAAKAAEYLTAGEKEYEATIRFGLTSDTEDATGEVQETGKPIPSQEEIEAILPRFRGSILQTPPMYSALKVNGKKLVDLARKGEVVERAPRPVEISKLEIEPTSDPSLYRLFARVSAGTYIRTLCADLGEALGCGAIMDSLKRTKVDSFTLDSAKTLDDLEQMSDEERASSLLPLECLFSDLPSLCLGTFHEKLIRSGCKVLTKKLESSAANLAPDTRVRILDGQGNFFALGEVEESEEGPVLKAIKTFLL
ncbi:MAG: tRNA pseudouridine(55) synthase TruB [Clostridia bacterium]|nr:tRNA pseudouridine(55) synthase TruB [Clostridia bacterium]